jgi:DNA repair photolyase
MNSLRLGHIRYNLHGNWINTSFSNTRLIVFWTKNPRPLVKHLDEIDRMGIGYYFLHTLNDYEREGLEPGLPALQERIETFKMLAERIGKERVVWRFDPLILTDKISMQALIDKVGSVMAQVAGYTEKMVFSFLDPNYKNGKGKLTKAGFKPRAFSNDEKAYVAKKIAEMAVEQGIQAAVCGEPVSLSEYGIMPNKCIDDDLIRRVFNKDAELMSFLDSVKGLEHNGQREYCHCIPSYDIGTENTCRNGCVYCYATASEEAVQNQLKRIEKDEALLAKSTPTGPIPAELN